MISGGQNSPGWFRYCFFTSIYLIIRISAPTCIAHVKRQPCLRPELRSCGFESRLLPDRSADLKPHLPDAVRDLNKGRGGTKHVESPPYYDPMV